MKRINELPIDNKSIMTHFTERFHEDNCTKEYDGVHRREVFELFGCRCDISYEYGKNWFRIRVLEGEEQEAMNCYNHFKDVVEFFNSYDRDKQIIFNPGTGLYGWYTMEDIPAVSVKTGAKGKKVYVLKCVRMYDYEAYLDVHVFNDLSDAIFAKDELVSKYKENVPEWEDEGYICEEDATTFECYKEGYYVEDSIKIDIVEKEVE